MLQFKHMGRSRRLILGALLLPVFVAGCREEAGARAPREAQEVAVTLSSSRIGPVQRQVEVVGSLYGDEEATVSAKVPGRVTRIFRDVGDRAAAGEPLAQIEETDYKLAAAQKRLAVQASLAKLGLSEIPPADFDLTQVPTVQRARLQSENAKAKYERGRKLHEQKPPLISDQDFADLETAYEVAGSNYDVELLTAQSLVADARALQSELEQALQQVSDTMIRAPGRAPETPRSAAVASAGEDSPAVAVAGGAGQREDAKQPGPTTRPEKTIRYAVASRLTSIGEYVREGTPLFRLVADDPIKFRAQVAERFLGQVKVGQAVRVKVEAYAEPFDGVVSRISPQVDLASRAFQVEMLLPNAEGKLQPGSFAKGAILTRVDPEVTLVPSEALVTFAGVTKVFTVDDQRKAVEKKVELGQSVGDAVEIVSGLEGVMPLVTQGRTKLAPGTPVVTSSTAAAPATQAVTGVRPNAD